MTDNEPLTLGLMSNIIESSNDIFDVLNFGICTGDAKLRTTLCKINLEDLVKLRESLFRLHEAVRRLKNVSILPEARQNDPSYTAEETLTKEAK